jgi:hypothetical protein
MNGARRGPSGPIYGAFIAINLVIMAGLIATLVSVFFLRTCSSSAQPPARRATPSALFVQHQLVQQLLGGAQ